MPVIKVDTRTCAGTVRIRAKATDPHEGLRGHDYISARGLNRPVQRLDDDAARRAETALHRLTASDAIRRAPVIPLVPKRRPA